MPIWYVDGDHWSSHQQTCTKCGGEIGGFQRGVESPEMPAPPQKTKSGAPQPNTQVKGTTPTLKQPPKFVTELKGHTEKSNRSGLKGDGRQQQASKGKDAGGKITKNLPGTTSKSPANNAQPSELQKEKARLEKLLQAAENLVQKSAAKEEAKTKILENLNARRKTIAEATEVKQLESSANYINSVTQKLTAPVPQSEVSNRTGSPKLTERVKLPPGERNERNKRLAGQLASLGILGKPPSKLTPPVVAPAPVVTAAPLPPIVVEVGKGEPKDLEANEKAKTAFDKLMQEASDSGRKLSAVNKAESDRYNNAISAIFDLPQPTNTIEKIAKLTTVHQNLLKTLSIEDTAKKEYEKIRLNCQNFVSELEKLNRDKAESILDLEKKILMLGTSNVIRLKQFTEVSKYISQLLDDERKYQAGVAKEEEELKELTKTLPLKTAAEVLDWKPEKISAMSPEQLITVMAKLTCGEDKQKDPKVVEALANLYRSMKPDPEFCDEDKMKRDQVLKTLKPQMAKDGEEAWKGGNVLANGKSADGRRQRDILETFKKQQLQVLGLPHVPTKFEKLETGNGGKRSLQHVIISTNPSDNVTFNEVINTVDHETTHAYQGHLQNKLKKGELQPEDPLYAQTVLFFLNNRAYDPGPAKKPVAPTGEDAKNERKKAEYKKLKEIYDLHYQAYKNQPTEQHAWTAGDEAGRYVDTLLKQQK